MNFHWIFFLITVNLKCIIALCKLIFDHHSNDSIIFFIFAFDMLGNFIYKMKWNVDGSIKCTHFVCKWFFTLTIFNWPKSCCFHNYIKLRDALNSTDCTENIVIRLILFQLVFHFISFFTHSKCRPNCCHDHAHKIITKLYNLRSDAMLQHILNEDNEKSAQAHEKKRHPNTQIARISSRKLQNRWQ